MDGLRFTDEQVEAPPRLEEEPKVVRSLRLSVDVEIRAKKIADARGVPVTTLMRRWIEDAIARAEGLDAVDPVTELGRSLADANRAFQRVAGGREAA
jgi:hypothetical protein